MYVAIVPNRSSPPAILLRESYREGREVKSRTLANLSRWPAGQVETLRRVLRGEPLVAPEEAFEIVRTRPHGHVAAVLGTLRRLGLDRLLAAQPSALQGFAYLVLYNVMFILPLLGILAIASTRPLLNRLARWNLHHKEQVRLALGSGVVLMGLAILATV